MIEILKGLQSTPLWIVIGAVAIYLFRNYFENRLKSYFANSENRFKSYLANAEKLVASSLSIKQDLRSQEQKELVEFRICVEKWEYFLQVGISDLIIKSGSDDFKPADFHSLDIELFGNVRIAAVKASILLRDPQLEIELLRTISTIRSMYYPLLESTVRDVLELQGQLLPFLIRMNLFDASGSKDLSVALNPDEAEIVVSIRKKMSDVLNSYIENLVAGYKPIAEQLYELKDKINVHIYRPLTSHNIHES
ncbi:hypothetical protein [Chamaesiphon sp. OTE_75_metabat_556]|uniref:hypothetical protein n=1 Tax=Chamaesiphon sp. OTE_75_metabat_556 TaxID=2964692 RepID=UPI002869ED8B|nr:hypothetical protein [Chamaesiphon sp. OTE_75_metabat_556]